MIACDDIISVMDIASTKMTNTIATNVSINSDSTKDYKYKIDCYILQTVLLVIILILIITFILLSLCKA